MRQTIFFILFVVCHTSWSESTATLEGRCQANNFADTHITLLNVSWEGSENNAYCKLSAEIERRTSDVDQQSYAIGFEMRLPANWNKRFLFQGNGGNDGRVIPATGASANYSVSALAQGFAVVSTDAGHQGKSLLDGAAFGFDPIARLNYGYRANQVLTPIAKHIIQQFYGDYPQYSYFAGCSNGGRHAMVAASRLSDEFDGFLAGDPGFNLPKAAIQHAWDIQALSTLNNDISQSLSQSSMDLLSKAVLDACDKLDGLQDGMVQATTQCQQHFDLNSLRCTNSQQDVHQNSAQDSLQNKCLDQKTFTAVEKLFAGPRNSQGEQLYSSWVFDAGVNGADWRRWKVHSQIANLPMIATLGAGSLANIFTTPPTKVETNPAGFVGYLRHFNFDTDAPTIYATTDIYSESAMSFMTPPKADQLSDLAENNNKLIVYHGASDGVFSVQDTVNWYQTLNKNHTGKANQFAKLFVVPGMNHCAGGPTTDQFDLLTTLVNWVEEGKDPVAVVARVNPNNLELPEDWSKQRSRLLCPYPAVATYSQGNKEDAGSFVCNTP